MKRPAACGCLPASTRRARRCGFRNCRSTPTRRSGSPRCWSRTPTAEDDAKHLAKMIAGEVRQEADGIVVVPTGFRARRFCLPDARGDGEAISGVPVSGAARARRRGLAAGGRRSRGGEGCGRREGGFGQWRRRGAAVRRQRRDAGVCCGVADVWPSWSETRVVAALLSMRVLASHTRRRRSMPEERAAASRRMKPRRARYAFFSFSRSKMLPKMPLGRKMMNSTSSTP